MRTATAALHSVTVLGVRIEFDKSRSQGFLWVAQTISGLEAPRADPHVVMEPKVIPNSRLSPRTPLRTPTCEAGSSHF